MKDFKKIAVALALVFSLLVCGVTAALAADDGAATDKETMLADKKAEIELNTPLSEYELPVVAGPLTWEEGTEELKSKTFGFSGINSQDEMSNFTGVETAEDGSNSYFTVRYSATNTVHTYPYMMLDKASTLNDIVIEFDFTTFDVFPSSGVPFQHSSTEQTDSGQRRYPSFFNVRADGTILPQNGQTTSASYVTPGEWAHFSLIFHREDCSMDIYVNYELVCENVNTRDSNAKTENFVMNMIRVGPNAQTNSEFSIDNFIAYEGSHIRTVDLFDNMSKPELFNYYVGLMCREGYAVGERKIAFDKASELISTYWNGSEFTPGTLTGELKDKVQASVELYNSFDYDEMYKGYIADNLDKFGQMVDELVALGRGLDLIADRNSFVSRINAHLNTSGTDILKTSTEKYNYNETVDLFEQCKEEIGVEENIVNFCKSVDKFYDAIDFNTTTLQRRYDAVKAFVANGIDLTLLGVEGFERYTEAYEKYLGAADILSEKSYNDNAKRIINCIDFIKEYDTVEEWEANYDYVNKYVLILRDAIRAGNYNTELEGLDEALEFFEPVNAYFYAKLQQQHIEYITERLDQYISTENYVGKMGICALVTAYLEESDIDDGNTQIAALVDRLNIYKSELEMIKDDYTDVLEQNTLYFKSLVEKMYTVTDYAELAALYEEARVLYIAMNVGDESISKHLEYYDEVNEIVKTAEESSASFILAAATLSAAVESGDKDAIYAALVDCYAFSNSAQVSIDGVAEAMELYVAQRDAYNSAVNASNTEIGECIHAIGSVRANCGAGSVVAVVVKKLED